MRKLRFAFAMIGIAFVTIIVYILLHESGHALVAALCGAENIKISILHAHTWWTGGNFTATTLSLCHMAGVVLPVCVSCAGILFYSKDCKNLIYHMAYAYFVVSATGAVLAWVLLPVYSMFAPLPDTTDDVARFLNNSSVSPILVSLGSALVFLFSIFLAKRKEIFQVLIHTIKDIRDGGTDCNTCLSKKAIFGVTAAVLTAILIAVLPELPDILTKPILSLSVTEEIPETKTVKSFDIHQEKQYHFQIKLKAEGLLADIRILDAEQASVYQLLSGQASASGTISLAPGTYTLSVTYLTDADMFERQCSAWGHSFDDAQMKDFRSIYEQEARLSRLLFVIK